MKGGVLVCKCRLCGAIDESPHVPDVAEAVVCITAGYSLPEDWGPLSPRLSEGHYCGPGRIGVSDLIGGHEDPKG